MPCTSQHNIVCHGKVDSSPWPEKAAQSDSGIFNKAQNSAWSQYPSVPMLNSVGHSLASRSPSTNCTKPQCCYRWGIHSLSRYSGHDHVLVQLQRDVSAQAQMRRPQGKRGGNKSSALCCTYITALKGVIGLLGTAALIRPC